MIARLIIHAEIAKLLATRPSEKELIDNLAEMGQEPVEERAIAWLLVPMCALIIGYALLLLWIVC